MNELGQSQKCVLILLDGIADRAHPELEHKTPLQKAFTPNLDRLASYGANGLYHALCPGVSLPSEAAHFFMMGYGPEDFPGRGYLEALGEDVPVDAEDVLLLAHLAVLERDGGLLRMVEKKPILPIDDTMELFETISFHEYGEGRLQLTRTRGSSGILAVKGKVSPHISDSDPIYSGYPVLEVQPYSDHEHNKAARRCAQLVNRYLSDVHERLSRHPINALRRSGGQLPVNGVVTQRAGKARKLKSLEHLWGIRALTVCSSSLYAGVFGAMGADAEVVAERSSPAQDLFSKLEMAFHKISRYDMVHVHTKATDEAAHRKDPKAKVDVICSLDEAFEGLWEKLAGQKDVLVIVTGDHATPSSGSMIHSGEPSPLSIFGPNVWRDHVSVFDEVHCAQGALGLMRGKELLLTILSLLDRSKLWGLRDCPFDLPYYPGCRKPLVVL
jgi:2,3-bisphosphoglycerate-independent phosphoglycerate mutase